MLVESREISQRLLSRIPQSLLPQEGVSVAAFLCREDSK